MLKGETIMEKVSQSEVETLKQAIEHRATWFALLIEEAEKRGLDAEFARDAICRCGVFHGMNKYPRTSDLSVFEGTFVNPLLKEVFQMEPERTDTSLKVSFHYCPLVEAWKKLGVPQEKMVLLCDIAMDGDRGVASTYEDLKFTLGKTIAQGNPTCEILFEKKGA